MGHFFTSYIQIFIPVIMRRSNLPFQSCYDIVLSYM